MNLKIIDCHNCNTVFNTNKYIEYNDDLKDVIEKAKLYDETCKMIKPIFKTEEQHNLSDAVNLKEYLDQLKQIRDDMEAIMNSWSEAEFSDNKDYAHYYVYEKNLYGDLYGFIEAMENGR